LSLSRFMSYLPLLSFGPSAIVSGSAYLLSPPFGAHFADGEHGFHAMVSRHFARS
jgi:hypothetical protein